jgi:hypothetical protein
MEPSFSVTNPPLSVIQGLFYLREGELSSQYEGEEFYLMCALRSFIGSEIDLLAHYSPSLPIDPSVAGGGSCLWGNKRCPHGHNTNPAYMFSVNLRGLLTDVKDNGCIVDGGFVSFLPLEGHKGRVIILSNPVKQDQSQSDPIDSLIRESGKLSELLTGLKKIL